MLFCIPCMFPLIAKAFKGSVYILFVYYEPFGVPKRYCNQCVDSSQTRVLNIFLVF